METLDSGKWESWPDFFTDDCIYKLQSRENYEKKHPLSTLYFESKNMLKDRIYAITQTLFHDPYYQRHIVSIPRILNGDENTIRVEANYAVFRTNILQYSMLAGILMYCRVLMTG